MFPKDFVWGTATSAYQIEGAAYEDGRGLSVWDVHCKEPGRVFSGHNGDVACDHYHRYKEDVALMAQLGIRAYRFSISWPRILPNGIGEVNQKGIEFYQNLIAELLKYDITPYVTLFHWDMPYELYKKGGFLNPDFPEWFAEYAKVVAENFSDKVKYFITFNEPQCAVGLGYVTGEHAPGLKCCARDTFQMAHNLLKAHGRGVQTLRKYAKQKIQVGYAPTAGVAYPASEKPEDIEAARKTFFAMPDLPNWSWNAAWFSDPVFLGKYPEEGLQKYKDYLPEITKEDMELIHQPLDFMGQNIYNGYMMKAGENGEPEYVDRKPGYTKTAVNWPVTPQAMRWGVKFLYDRYKMPIYITENGMACHDTIALDGKVHDSDRITFLNHYLVELEKAMKAGVEVAGYFLWSFMDNFEWEKGYAERFGIVYTDFETQERIAKDSAFWYKKIIESKGASLVKEQKELLFLNPVFKEMIWGGNRMREEYGYDIPGEQTGECWAVSAHPNGDGTIKNGELKGQYLSEVYKNHKELFGNPKDDKFPLLTKIIDAKDNLSIQVHPNDEYAKVHENGSLGKTECWYILDCDKDATIIIGHNAKTREELKEMIEEGKWSELIREIPIKKGDFFQINPGTVHAIKGGTMILESQQNSDITYRVYDYDRLQNGKPRQLHKEQSIDVITVPHVDYVVEKQNSNDPTEQLLVSCPYYKVWKFTITDKKDYEMKEAFQIVSVIEGSGMVDGHAVKKGDHFIIPYEYGNVHMEGKMDMIVSSPA